MYLLKFKKLVLNNYKTYYGHTEINLDIPNEEREKSGKNIILLGGLNGAGKTTFLKAILYSLFGERGMSASEYRKFSSNIINDTYHSEGGSECFISLTLETDNSEEWNIKVKWYFDKDKQAGHEAREVQIKSPGTTKSRFARIDNINAYYKLIDRIIPYYAAPFFIFDGEEIRTLITRQDQKQMKAAIHKITGMNANTQLIEDLRAIERSLEKKIATASNSQDIKRLQEDLNQKQAILDALNEKKVKYLEKADQLNIKIATAQKTRREKSLANSKSRDQVLSKFTKIDTQLGIAKKDLQDYLSENMQSIILAEKISQLKKQLKVEADTQRKKMIQQASLLPYEKFMQQLLEELIDPPLTTQQLQQLQQIGQTIWIKENNIKVEETEIKEIHDISSKDSQYITNIQIMDKNYPTQLINQISALEQEVERTEQELQNAPQAVNTSEDEAKISAYTKQLGEVQVYQKSNTQKLARAVEEKTLLENQISRLTSKETNLDELTQQLTMTRQSIKALVDYDTEYTRYKAQIIKNEFELMLKKLFRKQGEFARIEFDTDRYAVRLYNDRQIEINIEDRSAGEMQIISSALIWALTKASNLKLPVVIDTPLGRLDSHHRSNLIDNYYKEISDQVIILSTDTEISGGYVETMRAASYHQYLLDYNEEKKYTIVRDGYFEFIKE